MRALIYGIGLLALSAASGYAQGPAPGLNSAPTDHPSIAAPATPDSNTTPPEVVKPPGAHGDVLEPTTAQDPSAVVKPPNVDPGMQIGGAPK
jgi:hypothetical protein